MISLGYACFIDLMSAVLILLRHCPFLTGDTALHGASWSEKTRLLSALSGRRFALATLLLLIAGCAAPPKVPSSRTALDTQGLEYKSADIRIQLVGVRGAGEEGALVKDPGWLEYVLAVENSGRQPLTVQNVKLLSPEGRYLDSAASYEQVTLPPDAATEIAGRAATSGAGIAAGQVVPFGGAIVGLISSAATATSAESEASAKREFNRRKLKGVELAPAGRMTGSAYLPDVPGARALVVDYGYGGNSDRIEIPLPR